MKSTAITRSARDEQCTLQIVGWCNRDPATTVYAHFPDGTGGSNKLGGDIGNGGYACSDCHNVIDNRVKHRVPKEDLEFYMRRSVRRTLWRLIEKGFVRVSGVD